MSEVQRMGSVVQIKDDCIEEYCKLHANTWPSVLKQNTKSNLRNYNIFLRKMPDGKNYLFSYVEYIGNNFTSDMEEMASNKEVQDWWSLCKPMHIPFNDREEGEWWASMEQVFFQE